MKARGINGLAPIDASEKAAPSYDDDVDIAGHEDTTPEIILGRYETIVLPPANLIALSQVRGERNVVTDELKESILRSGLINQPDVSLMSYEAMYEYIAFTNHTWGAEANIEQFADRRLPDGRYPLLNAGHSRHQAILELIKEGKLPGNVLLELKISPSESVWDIVQRQIDENISSQPPKERRAMALVEAYSYGLHKGWWSSESEFIAIQNEAGVDVTKGPLEQALKYARLDSRVRNFILSGQIPYTAGVEMGATNDILTEYIARSNGYNGLSDSNLTPERRKLIADAVTVEFDIICNHITKNRLTATASMKHIQGKRMGWDKIVKEMRPNGRARKNVLQFEFEDDQLDIYLQERRRALEYELKDLTSKYRGSDIVGFLDLQNGILPENKVLALLEEFEARLLDTKEKLGSIGSTAYLHEEDLFGN